MQDKRHILTIALVVILALLCLTFRFAKKNNKSAEMTNENTNNVFVVQTLV